MSNLSHIFDAQPQPRSAAEARQIVATVVQLEPQLLVASAEGRLHAERATSCLVEPHLGDRVLVAETQEGSFVLAVLRSDKEELTLSHDGPLELKADKVRVAAPEGIELVTASALRWAAEKLSARVVEAEIASEATTLIAKLLRAHSDKASLLAKSIDSVADRVVQRVGRSYRMVEQSDNLRAGQMDYRVKETMGLRSKHTVMTSEELVKVDAGQIHMG